MKPINSVKTDINIIPVHFHGKPIVIFTFLFYFLISGFSISHGTTIIVARNDTELFIGADSLMLVRSGGIPDKVINTCKIKQMNNFFIASENITSIVQKGNVVFDVYTIADKVFSKGGLVQDKIAEFDRTVTQNLESVIEYNRIKDKASYIQNYTKGDKIVLGVIIVVVTNEYPVFFERAYKVCNSIGEPTIVKVSRATDRTNRLSPSDINVIFEGEYEAILKSTGKISKTALKDKIIEWISLEAKEKPNKVGLPIDILRITTKGAEWIQRKPECQEIQQY